MHEVSVKKSKCKVRFLVEIYVSEAVTTSSVSGFINFLQSLSSFVFTYFLESDVGYCH